MADRERYHHGDLRTALVDAGVAAARTGGAAAVGLNRLAAAVGVSPAAAYRHFPGGLDDLLLAVGDVCRRELTEHLEHRVAGARASREPRTAAQRRFRASGRGYVEYVLAQPGLFEVACRYDRGRTPGGDAFAVLERCLDDLVTAGALPAARRRDAAAAAWSAVHGVSLLLTAGPLRRLPPERRGAVVDRVLDMVQAGL